MVQNTDQNSVVAYAWFPASEEAVFFGDAGRSDESFFNLKREFPSIWFEILVARKRKFIPLLNLLINHSKKHRLIIEFPNELLIKYFSVSLGLLSAKKTLNNFSLSYDKTFNDLFEILLNGILTKKGKKLLAINKRINNENN